MKSKNPVARAHQKIGGGSGRHKNKRQRLQSRQQWKVQIRKMGLD